MSKVLNLKDKLISIFWYTNKESINEPNWLDGDGVKNLFDHVRNFTIAFAIGQAGRVAWDMPAQGGFLFLTKGFGLVFAIAAFLLFVINFLHLERKITVSMKPTWLKTVAHIFCWSIYFFVTLVGCMFNVVATLLK